MEYKELCLSCHPKRAEDMKKAGVHSPFKDMDCGSCHQPHDSTQPSLLTSDPKELCAGCHDAKGEGLLKAHDNIAEFSGPCTACHTPHGSANPKLILEGKEHVPFASRSCDMCHERPDKDGKPKLKPMPEKSCFVCHPDFKKLANKPVAHAPFQAGSCTDCHNPHVSLRPSLMKKAMAEVCFACHDAELKDSHPVARHPTSKEGRIDPLRKDKPFDCASCHEPHAGKLPKLMRDDPMTMCGSCHQK
ncbi:MAG: cytochrome c3 family protein [Elusimicrobia bacterium]|nr:cytochrome c3 family protein [Elusimicrobiota bacterium]